MKQLYFFLLLFLGVSHAAARPVSDSMLHADSIQRIFLREPDKALQLLDAAEQRRIPGLEPFRIDMLRSMCYEVKGDMALKERYVRRALASDSVRLVPRRRMRMLTSLAGVLEIQGKYDEGVRLCREAIDLARELGDRAEEGKMLFGMGRLQAGMNLLDEALESFSRAIGLMEDTDNVRELSQLSTAYGELATVLITNHRIPDALDALRRREKVIRRMSGMTGPPPGYIDQQYGFLYSKVAYLLQRENRPREAREYYDRFMSTNFARKSNGRAEIIPYLLEAHRYNEALQLNDAVASGYASGRDADTINYGYWILLDRYARAYRGLGRYDRSDDYQQRICVLQDSIYTREKASRAQELGTVFRLNEKELQLAEAQVAAQRRNFLLVGSCVVVVLLSLLLWIIWRNLRSTRNRNRIAVRQIDELLAQREELRRAFEQGELSGSGGAEIVAASPGVSVPESGTSVEYAVFMRMERQLMTQRLFLQPGFGRDDLLRTGNINKNDLPRLLQKYAGANNVSDYLNRLRVEYAVKLMKEKSHLSLDAIAQEANFNSHVTFYRAFYKVFGMTPAQYMRAQGTK